MSKELESYKIIEEEIIGSINDGRTKRIINLYKKQLQIIEEALKRNEPMKPLLKDMGFGHYDIYCPSCKEYIGYKNSVRQSLTLKYCPDCGQKLDRSEIR